MLIILLTAAVIEERGEVFGFLHCDFSSPTLVPSAPQQTAQTLTFQDASGLRDAL